MKTSLEKITPKIAEHYLKSVDPAHQRKLMKGRVDAYAREMVAGHWYQTHQGIGFDNCNRLIDGQHRLAAICQAGVTLNMLVTRGIVSETVNGIKLYAIDTIDTGYKRETGEQLALRNGIENASRVAAACRSILHWATGINKNTTPLSLEILNLYPSIKRFASFSKTHRNVTGCIIGCLAVAHKSFPEVDGFVESFGSGVGLSKNSPQLLLRNILINNPNHGGGKLMVRYQNWSFNALKAFVLKEEMKHLRNSDVGALFFKDQQKANVKKIRHAAGLIEKEKED
jgi:hypothetical protein